jgi:2-polyprenyl-3-methyl-5-hydroxy-6-metoxy-1,4-benzoquinol methylase
MTETNREILEACPWCSSSEQNAWGGGIRGFNTVLCGDCELIYVKNRFDANGLEQYYKNYLSNVHQDNPREVLDRTEMYRVEHEHITQFIKTGSVLDVGCSGGYFLDCFDQNNFDCYGVEFGQEAAEEAAKKYQVYQGEFDKIKIQKSFDLIIFRGVIEHIPYPKQYLNKAVQLLNDDGYVYITSTPDSDAFCCDLFKENWNQHEPEAHLMHFNRAHFDQYFADNGIGRTDSKSFYRETPYCNIEDDILKMAEAIKLKREGKQIDFRSPPFYENMMSLVYKN